MTNPKEWEKDLRIVMTAGDQDTAVLIVRNLLKRHDAEVVEVVEEAMSKWPQDDKSIAYWELLNTLAALKDQTKEQ